MRRPARRHTGGVDLNDVTPAWHAVRHPLPAKPELPDRAEARRRGPAAVVEAEWLTMRLVWEWRREAYGSRAPYRGTVALLEAAGAHPVLRQLYPVTSHFALRFSGTTEYPYEVVAPSVVPISGGRFRVFEKSLHEALCEADTAGEAVAQVAARLPPGLRLATTGRPLTQRPIAPPPKPPPITPPPSG